MSCCGGDKKSAATAPSEECPSGASCSPAPPASTSSACCPAPGGGGEVLEEVQEYYGKVLSTSSDLKTNACTASGAPPPYIRAVLALVHDEVLSKFYGCGLTVPPDLALDGLSVLDLGSGSGRDCFVLSKLVGERGRVVGLDMTPEQVEVARKHVPYHTEKFGYAAPNVEFVHGYMEKMDEAGIAENSFDLIISNCVVNLSPDKEAVLRQAYRALKPGGEMYFSDVYADRRVPEALQKDKILWGECLSGALYWKDFLRAARGAGFPDVRLVESSRITINNAAVEQLIGHVRFDSATYRMFKIAQLEDACEDYGQAVRYNGGAPCGGRALVLDSGHVFESGRVVPVCGNTFRMLNETRLAHFFSFYGSFQRHYGIFAGCGESSPFPDGPAAPAGKTSGGCC